jgi:hypothetical protein
MADDPNESPQVATIPSKHGEVSAIASGNAPFMYMDLAHTFNFYDGVVGVTLEAVGRTPQADKKIEINRVLVAHLRMSVEAAKNLRAALDNTIALSGPPPDTKPN